MTTKPTFTETQIGYLLEIAKGGTFSEIARRVKTVGAARITQVSDIGRERLGLATKEDLVRYIKKNRASLEESMRQQCEERLRQKAEQIAHIRKFLADPVETAKFPELANHWRELAKTFPL